VVIRQRIAGDSLLFRWRFAIDCAGDSLPLALVIRYRLRWRLAIESAGISLAKALAYSCQQRWRANNYFAGD
jgi:hypothetical protein